VHKRQFGDHIRRARGDESRLQFCRRLGLSYTFVRAIEHGRRLPSDRLLAELAVALGLDHRQLVLRAYCDRSPSLCAILEEHGLVERNGTKSSALRNGRSRGGGSIVPRAPSRISSSRRKRPPARIAQARKKAGRAQAKGRRG
jgi:transcriptional regulator with XRE-family HTH domain